MHALEPSISFQGRNFCVLVKGDCRIFFNTADQVPRHGVSKRARTDQHMPMLGGPLQENRGLPPLVAATHDHHFLTSSPMPLAKRRAIVTPRSLKTRATPQ